VHLLNSKIQLEFIAESEVQLRILDPSNLQIMVVQARQKTIVFNTEMVGEYSFVFNNLV
jgi:hypothetical protein